jgi:hypothetical protein
MQANIEVFELELTIALWDFPFPMELCGFGSEVTLNTTLY